MSERSEQWCFEIMNMNDKHSYSLLMRLVDFSAEKFFSPEFSAEKIFQNFFSKIFFSRIFSGKIFQNFFSKIFFSRIFSGKIFQNFFSQFFSPEFSAEKIFQKFFSPEFSAEYFFRITQRNPRIEFIGISFPFNQGFLFLLVAANNFFNSKNILICLLQFRFVK